MIEDMLIFEDLLIEDMKTKFMVLIFRCINWLESNVMILWFLWLIYFFHIQGRNIVFNFINLCNFDLLPKNDLFPAVL